MAAQGIDIMTVKVSSLYVSCMGNLCVTMTFPKIGCFCYEVLGVNLDGTLILKVIE